MGHLYDECEAKGIDAVADAEIIRQRIDSGVWIIKDGETIRIVEMGDRHLLNAHRLIYENRLICQHIVDDYNQFHPDIIDDTDWAGDVWEFAPDSAKQAAHYLEDSSIRYEKLSDEISRRKLDCLMPRKDKLPDPVWERFQR